MRRVAIAAVVALASAQNPYVWNGQDMMLSSTQNWVGASPWTPNNLPLQTMLGANNGLMVTSLPSDPSGSINMDVGNRIMFHGQVLINGPSSGRSRIVFGSAGPRPNVATFRPPTATADATSPGFAWGCNLNWLVNDQVPGWAPCTTDDAQIPDDDTSYFVSTFGVSGSARSVSLEGSQMSSNINVCPAPDNMNNFADLVGRSLVTFPMCTATFKFFPAPGYVCPTTGAVQPQCVASGSTNGILTGSTNSFTSVAVITTGPFAGQAFQVTANGMLTNRTSAVSVTNAASATLNGIYFIDGRTFNGRTGAVTSGGDPNNGANSAGGSSSSSGFPIFAIAIIVAVAVVAAIIIVVVVVRRKGGEGRDGTVKGHESIAFENPMYQDASVEQGANQAHYEQNAASGGYMDIPFAVLSDGGALYDETDPEDEPEQTQEQEDEAHYGAPQMASGYMDVKTAPEPVEEFYDEPEVAANATTGYMDVKTAPEAQEEENHYGGGEYLDVATEGDDADADDF